MNSREYILAKIAEKNKSLQFDYPEYNFEYSSIVDPIQSFCASLELVGGKSILVENSKRLSISIKNTDVFKNAKEIASLYKNITGNIELSLSENPHSLKNLDLMIVEVELGVAENGAVWIDTTDMKNRICLFICQHLIFVLKKESIVSNMQQAYNKLNFSKIKNGYFISGPSKTADIEQSLVIGAQGARSCTVFIY